MNEYCNYLDSLNNIILSQGLNLDISTDNASDIVKSISIVKQYCQFNSVLSYVNSSKALDIYETENAEDNLISPTTDSENSNDILSALKRARELMESNRQSIDNSSEMYDEDNTEETDKDIFSDEYDIDSNDEELDEIDEDNFEDSEDELFDSQYDAQDGENNTNSDNFENDIFSDEYDETDEIENNVENQEDLEDDIFSDEYDIEDEEDNSQANSEYESDSEEDIFSDDYDIDTDENTNSDEDEGDIFSDEYDIDEESESDIKEYVEDDEDIFSSDYDYKEEEEEKIGNGFEDKFGLYSKDKFNEDKFLSAFDSENNYDNYSKESEKNTPYFEQESIITKVSVPSAKLKKYGKDDYDFAMAEGLLNIANRSAKAIKNKFKSSSRRRKDV